MNASETIRKARDIIAESGWCQGTHARDAAGNGVPLFAHEARSGVNPSAVSFSIYGAIVKAAEGQPQTEARLMWNALQQMAESHGSLVTGGTNFLHPVMGYNEQPGRTVDEVIEFLTLCAEHCERGPKAPDGTIIISMAE